MNLYTPITIMEIILAEFTQDLFNNILPNCYLYVLGKNFKLY